VRSGPASDALSVAVTLGFLLAAAAAAVIIWALATRERGASVAGGRQRTPFWRRMLVVMFIGLLVGVAVAFVRKRPHTLRLTGTTGADRARDPHQGTSLVHFSPAASLTTVLVVATIILMATAWSLMKARRRGRGWSLRAILLGAQTDLSPSATGSEAQLAESLATVRIPDPEEETDPRAAVVAAYVAMTHAAAAAGATRRSDETPAEFLQRLLDSLGASHEAARRLTFLFETARYSTQPFEETRRSDAIIALRQIQAELKLDTVGGARPAP
jgi:hypothetical protein